MSKRTLEALSERERACLAHLEEAKKLGVSFSEYCREKPMSMHQCAYFAQGRPAIHGMPVHGFTPCRSSAHEAGRAELSIRDEHSSIV